MYLFGLCMLISMVLVVIVACVGLVLTLPGVAFATVSVLCFRTSVSGVRCGGLAVFVRVVGVWRVCRVRF